MNPTANIGLRTGVAFDVLDLDGPTAMASMKDIDKLDSREFIIIKGARVHNLKNIDIALPRNKFIVITGLSGSGKSSLAFDTLSTYLRCPSA